MAQKQWIARAGQGLLNVLALLMRGIGAMFAVFSSFVLFAWGNEEPAKDNSKTEPKEVDGEEAKSYGWDSY